MKTQFITLFTILCIAQSAFSQQYPRKFGPVSPEELASTSYEKDPEAEAVILFDKGESFFYSTQSGGYDIRFTRTKRIKILDRAGTRFAEVSIPFYVDGYGRTEKIVALKATSYNLENGSINTTELQSSSVYEEQINKTWKRKKFVIPDVREGTIIEYRYVVETPFHFNLPDWKFQDRIPTVYSEYIVKMIPFYEYIMQAKGFNRFSYYNSQKSTDIARHYGGLEFQDMDYIYVQEHVSALKDESYITSVDDYIMQVDFQLSRVNHPDGRKTEIMTTWPKLIKSLLDGDGFGKYIKKSKKLAEAIVEDELKLDGKSDAEKAKIIIEYVKSSFSWNHYYGKYASKKPKEFILQKEGSAAEINLFMLALLQAAQVRAQPVIISTRDHGKINSEYPFASLFNYVILLVSTGKKSFLTDGTEDMIAYNRIPPRCINEKGLLVQGKEAKWLDLYSNINSMEGKTMFMDIDPKDLLVNTTVSIQCTEFESYKYKSIYKNDTIQLKTDMLEEGFSDIFKLKTLNYEESNAPYVISLEGEAEVEALGNKLIVSPFLNFPIQENKLTQKERSYPVDFVYAKTEIFNSIINIPEGYKVLFLPENYSADNELVHIQLEFKQYEHAIEAKGTYSFKNAVYQAGDYARIKNYFDRIVKKFNEQIVFEEV